MCIIKVTKAKTFSMWTSHLVVQLGHYEQGLVPQLMDKPKQKMVEILETRGLPTQTPNIKWRPKYWTGKPLTMYAEITVLTQHFQTSMAAVWTYWGSGGCPFRSLGEQFKHRVVLPATLAQPALNECHDALAGGHIGHEKTLQKNEGSLLVTKPLRDCKGVL